MNQSFLKRPFFWYGIYYGITSVLVFIIQYFLLRDSLSSKGLTSIISLVIMVAFMTLSGMAERNNNGGYLTYGKTFKAMFLTALVGIIIFTLFSYIFNNYYAPEYTTEMFEKQMEETRAKLEENPKMTEEQIEQGLKVTKWFYDMRNSILFQFIGIIMFSIMAAIIALLTAIFVKRNPPEGMMMDEQILDSEN